VKTTMPKGFRPASGDPRPRVAVTFDEDLFEEIRLQALREKKGFSEMVRELCRVGLFDLRESDELEPAA
jgi:hypothetical protein